MSSKPENKTVKEEDKALLLNESYDGKEEVTAQNHVDPNSPKQDINKTEKPSSSPREAREEYEDQTQKKEDDNSQMIQPFDQFDLKDFDLEE